MSVYGGGAVYDDILEEFMDAAQDVFPGALFNSRISQIKMLFVYCISTAIEVAYLQPRATPTRERCRQRWPKLGSDSLLVPLFTRRR